MIEGVFMFLIFACGAAAGFIGGTALSRLTESRGNIWDWEEEAYKPRREEPRVVTRIKSENFDWEIK